MAAEFGLSGARWNTFFPASTQVDVSAYRRRGVWRPCPFTLLLLAADLPIVGDLDADPSTRFLPTGREAVGGLLSTSFS